MVTPPEDTLDHPDLASNLMQNVPLYATSWDPAMRVFRSRICKTPLSTIYRHFDDIPKYVSHRMDYMTPEASLKKIRLWFQFQFGG